MISCAFSIRLNEASPVHMSEALSTIESLFSRHFTIVCLYGWRMAHPAEARIANASRTAYGSKTTR
jgi:hypothetical protein